LNENPGRAGGPAPGSRPRPEPGPTPLAPPVLVGAVLLDEHADPPLRESYGRLLATAEEADFAVGRVRLAGIDMTGGELAGVRRCRLLLGRLDVDTLMDANSEARLDADRRARLERLRTFVGSGRIQIRSAGMQQWSPDFSVFRGLRHPPGESRESGDSDDSGRSARGAAVVLGPHHFARTSPDGTAITAILPGEAAAALATRRFEAMFERAYDVTGVVLELLGEMLAGRPAPGP